MLKTARAIYKEGTLIFDDKQVIPKDGTLVTLTFYEGSEDNMSAKDAIAALRRRGKGKGSVEKLLQSRREDLELDEKNYKRLRS